MIVRHMFIMYEFLSLTISVTDQQICTQHNQAQPYDVELSVRIVFKSERPIIPGNRKNKQKLQMKQNPTNSIKAGYRVELRAKNHIKITSDNLMLSEVNIFRPINVSHNILECLILSSIIPHFA